MALTERGWFLDFYSVQVYDNKGVMLNGGSKRQGLPVGAGGQKGNISGWSSASRRNMREFLVQNTFPEGWQCVGGSFTVPGEDIGPVTAHFKELIRQFGQFIQRKMSGGMVWRMELQTRKMPHLHTLIIVPNRPEGWTFQGKIFSLWEFLRWVWFYYIDSVLPSLPGTGLENIGFAVGRYVGWYSVEDIFPGKEGQIETAIAYNWKPEYSRHCRPWAWKYAVDIQQGGGSGAWLRYLQDHATKAKQGQVAENMGRHWGVVGRNTFQPVEDVQEYVLSAKQYAHVIRQGGRLACPRVKDARALFGYRLGYIPHRGRIGCGRAVVFSSSETYLKIIREALRLYPEIIESSIYRIIRALRWGVMRKQRG
jgi:hypothetical protein